MEENNKPDAKLIVAKKEEDIMSFLKGRLRDTDHVKDLIQDLNGTTPWHNQELLLETVIFLDMIFKTIFAKMPVILLDSAFHQMQRKYTRLWTHEAKCNKSLMAIARDFAAQVNQNELNALKNIIILDEQKKNEKNTKDETKDETKE